MKQQCIKIKDLKGYRRPTQYEKQQIWNYMESELLKYRKQMKFFNIVFICFATAMTMSVISHFVGGMIDKKNLVVEIIITMILWIVSVALRKGIITNKRMTMHVQNGEYEVIECLSYGYHYAQEGGRTEGSVKIQTKDGLVCEGNFVVDIETALLSEKGEILPLLLLYERETATGRVFSQKMLSKG